MSEDEVRQLEKTEMPPEHNHLNDELGSDQYPVIDNKPRFLGLRTKRKLGDDSS
ncbi:MAG: hypothetical protein AB2652_15725 [Candidatus Thiodiazotropha endolucinida]